MQLKVATDYAIRIVLYLAATNRIVSSQELSKQMGIPKSFVYKITTKLQESGILKNHTGVKGGFSLVLEADKMTLYQIISVMEPTMKINRCLEDDLYCSRFATENCPVRKFYTKYQDLVEQHLKSMTIEELLK